MLEFNYVVDTYLRVWQRTDVSIEAETQEEADALIKTLVKRNPVSLENENANIQTGSVTYLCGTESLIESTTETPTVEIYHTDCESYETRYALYTNLKRESSHSINKDFRTVIDIRKNYTSQVRDILSRILKQEKAPIVLANEKDETDDEVDVIVACSGHSGAYNGRVLSVWLNQDTICIKVEHVGYSDVMDIEESDLEDDGLYFIINRILNPVNKDI